MEKEDKILLGTIEDRIEQCETNYMITNSLFLNLRQRAIVNNLCKGHRGLRYDFFGGYDDAERVIAVFLPDYIAGITGDYFVDNQEESPILIVRAHKAKGTKKLTHGDYLGSVLGLGIKREMVGDILVREDGADIVVMGEIGEFLLFNYEKAGRTELTLSLHPISELTVPAQRTEEKSDTVASLRLDNMVSSAFGISRGSAAEAIRRGIVFVNNLEASKIDIKLKEWDKIVLRGKGKVVLKSIGGQSRKDRTYVTFLKYI